MFNNISSRGQMSFFYPKTSRNKFKRDFDCATIWALYRLTGKVLIYRTQYGNFKSSMLSGTIKEGADETADITLDMNNEVFLQLIDGSTTTAAAYMSGNWYPKLNLISKWNKISSVKSNILGKCSQLTCYFHILKLEFYTTYLYFKCVMKLGRSLRPYFCCVT